MARYAENTSVGVDKSKAEIERTLSRYGADEFYYGIKSGMALIGFRMNNRCIKMQLPLPDKDSEDFRYTPSRGFERSAAQVHEAWEQACRQAWRALALVVKAKLEAVEAGISDFESEFLASIVLPDGWTVGQFMRPQIEWAYSTGSMPELLPGMKALPTGDETQ